MSDIVCAGCGRLHDNWRDPLRLGVPTIGPSVRLSAADVSYLEWRKHRDELRAVVVPRCLLCGQLGDWCACPVAQGGESAAPCRVAE